MEETWSCISLRSASAPSAFSWATFVQNLHIYIYIYIHTYIYINMIKSIIYMEARNLELHLAALRLSALRLLARLPLLLPR